MTVEEIQSRFDELDKQIVQIDNEIEKDLHSDPHLDFINSLKQYVNKY